MHSFITEAPASQLWGFELEDGRVIAVKVRATSPRLDACAAAHRTAYAEGIDCPAPLAGPSPMADDPELAVLAETWRSDGAIWPSEDPPGNYGRLQAALVPRSRTPTRPRSPHRPCGCATTTGQRDDSGPR